MIFAGFLFIFFRFSYHEIQYDILFIIDILFDLFPPPFLVPMLYLRVCVWKTRSNKSLLIAYFFVVVVVVTAGFVVLCCGRINMYIH